MKKLNTDPLFIILFITINLFSNSLISQYKVINPEIEGIYLCEPIDKDVSPKYLSRSTLDSTISSLNGDVYYPFKTLTDKNNHLFCDHIATNNWLGETITHDTNLHTYVFDFEPIIYNAISDSYQLAATLPISIPDTLSIGNKFQLNTFIEGEVISESFISWNNTQIEVSTVKVTNQGNPNYKWQTENIIISKDYGIFSFPNLQYFPFEWRNCTLVGLTEPNIGVQDVTNKDIYRMSPGDEFTAERSYTYAGPNFDVYYERIKCLAIIEETDTSQRRSIQREIVRLTPLTLIWIYRIDTLEENIIYDHLYLRGSANETFYYDGITAYYIVVNEAGIKSSSEYTSWDQNECYDEVIDGCNGSYSFAGGFAVYYDCSMIFNFTDYYLPVHRIVNGEEFGFRINFDSILQAQFIPVRPNNAGLFLCTHSNDTEEKEYLTSEFYSINYTSAVQTFIPIRSLTSLYNSSGGANTSWMGDSVEIDFDAQLYRFNYRPVKFDQNQHSNVITPQRSFSLPFDLSLGKQFTIDPYISAEVVSEASVTWEGLILPVLTIRLTHDGSNPDYNWTTGNIVITQKYGIHEFPNLHYFPYQWNKCVLAGLVNPPNGVQDLSTKDIYRMEEGDEYTAERFNQVIEHYFQIKKCLSVISEDDEYQERIVEIKKYNQSYVDFKWSLQLDTINETIVYDEQIGAMHAGELRKDIGKYCRMDGSDTKKIYDVYDNGTDSVMYHRPIDDCGPSFVLKHGFDDYFDFSFTCASGPWSNYYLMTHSIVNGDTTGTPLNVDSLLSNRKIIQLEVAVFPNPSSGNFVVEVPKNLELNEFYLIDVQGKRNKIRAVRRTNQQYNLSRSTGDGIYMLQAVSNEGKIYSLGKIVLIQ